MAKHGESRAKVLAALPGCAYEVIERTGLGAATVSRYLKSLEQADEIHLHHKRISPHGGPMISVFHPGPAPAGFKPRIPKPTSSLERTRRYRRNSKKTGAWQDMLAQHRAYYWRKKKPKRDTLMSAFFGAT